MPDSTRAFASLDSSRQSGVFSTPNIQLQSSAASSSATVSLSPTETLASSGKGISSISNTEPQSSAISLSQTLRSTPSETLASTQTSILSSTLNTELQGSIVSFSSTTSPRPVETAFNPSQQESSSAASQLGQSTSPFSSAHPTIPITSAALTSSPSPVISLISTTPKITSLSATTQSSLASTVQTKDVEAPNLSVGRIIPSSTTVKTVSTFSVQQSMVSSSEDSATSETSIASFTTILPNPGPAPTPVDSMASSSSVVATSESSSPIKIIQSSSAVNNSPGPAISSKSSPTLSSSPSQSTASSAESASILRQTSTTTVRTTQTSQTQAQGSTASNKPQSSVPAPTSSTSTTISVHLIKASTTTPIGTSTITTSPESTLSSLVVVTVTDGSDGRKSLFTPQLVTLLSTSTEPDGGFVTFTHVVANPTGFSTTAQDVNRSGFIHNQGAVAGVFVVVGIVVAAVGIGIYWCFLRRRRINRRKRWLAGMRRQPPPSLYGNPFEDPLDPAPMRSVDQRDAASLHSTVPYRDEPNSPGQAGIGLTGFNNHSPRKPAPEVVFPEIPQLRSFGPTPLEYIHPDQSRQSTPSIYPPSLPANDDLVTPVSPTVNKITMEQPERAVLPPPRPPRSHLRDTLKRALEYAPLTPPASISSHAGSAPETPVSEASNKSPQDLLSRRTLLDVRLRPSQE